METERSVLDALNAVHEEVKQGRAVNAVREEMQQGRAEGAAIA